MWKVARMFWVDVVVKLFGAIGVFATVWGTIYVAKRNSRTTERSTELGTAATMTTTTFQTLTAQLQSALTQLTNANARQDQTDAQLNTFRKSLAEAHEDIEKLKSTVARRERSIEALQSELKQHRDESERVITQMHDENVQLRDAMLGMEQSYTRQIEELQDRCTVLTVECETLRRQQSSVPTQLGGISAPSSASP
jgi:chromosome segregation ATPase